MNFPDQTLPPIVLVDDSQDDLFLLRYRLRLGGIANPLATFGDCGAATAYLRSYFQPPLRPQLLFADIKMDGAWDLIHELRHDHRWDELKIVVATYSNDSADLQRALELGINAYMLKFPASENLARLVRHGPWLTIPHRIAPVSQQMVA